MSGFQFLALLAVVGLLLSSPFLACACSCSEGTTVEKSLDGADGVFRGFVLRKLNDVNFQSIFVVRANRVFKGCDFDASDRIIVSTGSDSAMCGVDLRINGTYVFSGFHKKINVKVQKQISDKDAIVRAMSFGLCDYNAAWAMIPSEDLRILRHYDNSQCVPNHCTTGVDDCPDTHFCDKGSCVAYDESCPVYAVCSKLPCRSANRCNINNAKCHDNYCGGCNAIFVDSSGTRVCQS